MNELYTCGVHEQFRAQFEPWLIHSQFHSLFFAFCNNIPTTFQFSIDLEYYSILKLISRYVKIHPKSIIARCDTFLRRIRYLLFNFGSSNFRVSCRNLITCTRWRQLVIDTHCCSVMTARRSLSDRMWSSSATFRRFRRGCTTWLAQLAFVIQSCSGMTARR